MIHDETKVFCHLVVEEFLMANKMHATLNSFRSEWERPDENIAIPSWYNVALKLQMPELVSRDTQKTTVLENVINALTKESSIRSRRPIEVVASALTMPKNTMLPDISDPQGPFPVDTLRLTQSADGRKERKKPATPGPAIISGPPHQDTTFAAAMHRGNKNSARASSKLDHVMQRLMGDTTNLISSKLIPTEIIDKYAPTKQVIILLLRMYLSFTLRFSLPTLRLCLVVVSFDFSKLTARHNRYLFVVSLILLSFCLIFLVH